MTNYKRVFFLGIFLTIVVFWYAKPLIWSVPESESTGKIPLVHHTDEKTVLSAVQTAYESGNYKVPIIDSGHLYFDIALSTLYLSGWITDISEQQMLLILRFLSLFFGIFSVLMLFQLARRFVDIRFAWLTVGMFILIPLSLWSFSFRANPAIMHLFFVICSLYWCSFIPLRSDSKPFYLAVLFAALAFSVTFRSVTLLPVIFLVLIFHQCTREQIIPYGFRTKRYLRYLRVILLLTGLAGLSLYWFMTPEFVTRWIPVNPPENGWTAGHFVGIRKFGLITGSMLLILVIFQPLWNYLEANTPFTYNIRLFLYKVGLSVLLFALVFSLTSPYLLLDANFFKSLLQNSDSVSGTGIPGQEYGFMAWFQFMQSDYTLDSFTFWCAILGFILSAIQLFVKGVKTRRATLWISSLWVTAFYLTALGRNASPTYQLFLPILPFIILLSAYAILSTYRKLLDFMRPRRRYMFEFVFVILVILGYFLANFSEFKQFRTETARPETVINNPETQALNHLKISRGPESELPVEHSGTSNLKSRSANLQVSENPPEIYCST